VEHCNIKIAVCDIVNKKTGIYNDKFDIFYTYVKENFLKNYEKLLEFVDKQISSEIFKEKPVFHTNYYTMNVIIDYELLRNKLIECKNTI